MKSNRKYCVANVHMNSLGEVSVSYRAYMKGPYGAHFVGDIDDEYVLWYDTEEEARGMIYNREGECILSRLTEYIPKFQDKEANCTDHKEEEKSMAATKDQELKALSQIKKIVEELGEGSYVGMAFEGCFEIAEDNIGNDFGNSMKMRAETAERKLEEITRALEEKGDGFIMAMWCGDEACEDKVKEVTGVGSRCIPMEQRHIADTCVCCGKPAKHMVYWGKAY